MDPWSALNDNTTRREEYSVGNFIAVGESSPNPLNISKSASNILSDQGVTLEDLLNLQNHIIRGNSNLERIGKQTRKYAPLRL